jgi:hypothetical protein
MKRRWLVILAVLIVIAAAVWLEPTGIGRGFLRGEQFFGGRPSSYWAGALLSDDPVRQETARLSLSSGGSSAVDVLCELLEYRGGADWQAAEVRWRSAEILGAMGPGVGKASDALLKALEDTDPHVQSVAAANLPNVNVPAQVAVPALAKMLNGPTRLTAIRALSEYGSEARPALEQLLEILAQKELSSEIRWNAARTVGKMQASAQEAIPALIEFLNDEAPTVREHCAEALGDIGPPAKSAASALVEVLDDPAPRVRRDAARSLGQIGADAELAVPALKKLLADQEDIVRRAARTALRSLAPDEPLPDPKENK